MRRSWRPEWIDYPETTQEDYDDAAAAFMPELPPIDPADNYIISRLMDLGPTVAAGMSAGPVTYTEMDAYIRVTGASISGEDARLLRRLSTAYLSESHKATENFAEAPWWPEGGAAEQQAAEGIPRPLTKAEVEQERQKRLACG